MNSTTFAVTSVTGSSSGRVALSTSLDLPPPRPGDSLAAYVARVVESARTLATATYLQHDADGFDARSAELASQLRPRNRAERRAARRSR